MPPTTPTNGTVWLHDPACGRWLCFSEPIAQLRTHTLADVAAVVAEAEAAADRGLWAVGVLAYEAAGAFETALATRSPVVGQPLAWFGLYPPPQAVPPPHFPEPIAVAVAPDLSEDDYVKRVGRVHAAIAAGDTYQVNLTLRLQGDFDDDPWRVFAQLQAAQPGGFGAYLDLGDVVIASASPELFWRLDGETITMRPMKGTRRRGRWPAEDAALAAELVASEKDRAENVMIVDMARNDLGRIASTGSVRVPALFTPERYPTVWQMTSTVTAETRAGLDEILRACFPCASITGAPKASTMRLIRDLETTPRGVYTGTIGYWAPGRRAQFNVAIRTAVIDRVRRSLTYGIGSGVVWDSGPVDEYHECLLKGRALTELATAFELIETLRWSPDEGFALVELHLDRLLQSARRFGFALDLAACRAALDESVVGARDPVRVRLTVTRAGVPCVTTAPAPPVAWLGADPTRQPLCLRFAIGPIDDRDPWLFHKTTRRGVYEQALMAARRLGSCDDVVLWNARGEVTETTIGNLVVAYAGRRLTPPVSSGLLPGTFRRWLLERGMVEEAIVTRTMLGEAEAVWRVNALRGWEAARLTGEGAQGADGGPVGQSASRPQDI